VCGYDRDGKNKETLMSIEDEDQLQAMKAVGRIVAAALHDVRQAVRPGVTTAQIDAHIASFLRRHDARHAPQSAYNFPGFCCISVNDEAVHGIPGPRVLQPGDLVKIDLEAEHNHFIADAAISITLDPISKLKNDLCACAARALAAAMKVARAGEWINSIGAAVETETRRCGFHVIRELCGHGVGRRCHEEPTIPNYYEPRQKQRLSEGLVITIEPIIAAGAGRAYTSNDGWTMRTIDGSPAAHVEHTIVVTKGEPILLTAV
jgi:methionyl aminopeptidase